MESAASGRIQATVISCDEIEPGLYVGGIDAAEDENLLQHLKVTHVLTVDCFPLKITLEVEKLFVAADDRPDSDLLSHFDETNDFIQRCLEDGGRCLVHCFGGMSRSATLVIAYLMQKHKISLENALMKVREKRSIVSPNPGFMSQLQMYELMKFTLDKKNIQYRMYLLNHVAKNVVNGKPMIAIRYADMIEESGNDYSNSLSCKFKCKKCRHILFNSNSFLHHYIGTDPKWDRMNTDSVGRICNRSVFIDPLPYMMKGDLTFQGKILCPKCSAKFGTYNWGGIHCPCGARVVPGFKITESKVDKVSL